MEKERKEELFKKIQKYVDVAQAMCPKLQILWCGEYEDFCTFSGISYKDDYDSLIKTGELDLYTRSGPTIDKKTLKESPVKSGELMLFGAPEPIRSYNFKTREITELKKEGSLNGY